MIRWVNVPFRQPSAQSKMEDMAYTADITVDSSNWVLTEAGNDFASMLRQVKHPDRPAIGMWAVVRSPTSQEVPGSFST